MEDDDGNNWTLLEVADFDPAVVYPGAVLRAGVAGRAGEVQALPTELFLGARSVMRGPRHVPADPSSFARRGPEPRRDGSTSFPR